MAQAKVEGTKILAYQLEDIVAAKNAKSGVIHWSLTDKDSTPFEYKWHTYYKPIAFKIAAIIFAILSIFSFLGVICSMHGVDNNVSVYFIAVHDADSTLGRITLFILITLGYTAYLTIWSIFQMRLGGKMELVPHRTTPKCLSFNVRMCARLAAPLAFFYLGWISENGIKKGDWLYNDAPDTYVNGTVPVIGIDGNVTYVNGTITLNNAVFVPSAFSDFYQLQSVGIIQKTFGTVFPILLFCVVGLIITNIFNRLLVFAKLEQYQFGAEIVTDEQLREGKRQLLRHKKTTVILI